VDGPTKNIFQEYNGATINSHFNKPNKNQAQYVTNNQHIKMGHIEIIHKNIEWSKTYNITDHHIYKNKHITLNHIKSTYKPTIKN
jgi:hypothetical protein